MPTSQAIRFRRIAADDISQPFAAALRDAPPTTDWPADHREFGSVYVIDPIGVERVRRCESDCRNDDRRNVIAVQRFPLQALRRLDYRLQPLAAVESCWRPLAVNVQLAGASSHVSQTPGRSAVANGRRHGRTDVSLNDDLSLDLPRRQDKPSHPADANLAISMATAKPTIHSLGNRAATIPGSSRSCPRRTDGSTALGERSGRSRVRSVGRRVSTSAFCRAILPTTMRRPTSRCGTNGWRERRVVSTGLSGGEILLERHANDTESPKAHSQNLKVGQLDRAVRPASEEHRRRAHCSSLAGIACCRSKKDSNWHHHAIADEPAARFASRTTMAVAAGGQPDRRNNLSNNLCVGIIPSVVAVHSKTVQLEGKSAWSVAAEWTDVSRRRASDASTR